MRCGWISVVCVLVACDAGRSVPGGGGGGRTVVDGGRARDGSGGDGAGVDDAGSGRDSATAVDSGSAGDAAGLDSGGARDAAASADSGGARDAAGVDSGGARDAAATADAGFARDASGVPDSGPPPGEVNVTTRGCTADFGGDIVVSYNGSLGVGSLRGFSLAASLQFDLRGMTGRIALSSQHRIQTGVVVNLVTSSTWTNLAQDSRVITGQAPDPITGTLDVSRWDPANGIATITLTGVTLENPSTRTFCTIEGTVRTTRLGR